MGRKRKNPKLLDAKGTFQKHPEFRPKGFDPLAPDPKPICLGEPPAHLSEELQAVWREYAPQVIPSAVTGSGDRVAFEVFVRLYSRQQRNEKLNAAETKQLLDLTARFLPTSVGGAVAAPVESKMAAFLRKGREHDAAMAAMSPDQRREHGNARQEQTKATLAQLKAAGIDILSPQFYHEQVAAKKAGFAGTSDEYIAMRLREAQAK